MKNSTNSIKRMLVAAVGATSVAATLLIGVAAPANAAVAAKVRPAVSTNTVATNEGTIQNTVYTWFTGVRKVNGATACVNNKASIVSKSYSRTLTVIPMTNTTKVPFQKGKRLILKKVKKGQPICVITATKSSLVSGSSTNPSGGSSTSPSGGSSTNPSGGSSTSPSGGAQDFVMPTVTLVKVVTRPYAASDAKFISATPAMVDEFTYRLSGGTFMLWNVAGQRQEKVRGEDYYYTFVAVHYGVCSASLNLNLAPYSGGAGGGHVSPSDPSVPGYDRSRTDYASCAYSA